MEVIYTHFHPYKDDTTSNMRIIDREKNSVVHHNYFTNDKHGLLQHFPPTSSTL
jgi:hypothetical protein